MNYLTLENVTKVYGDKTLFKDITLYISKGDKIALVAKNGTGKSTLMRILCGEDTSEGEQSRVWLHKDVKIGFLHQEPEFDDRYTILEAVLDSDNPMIRAIKRYEEALIFTDRQEQLQAAMLEMEELGAWDFEAKIKEILTKFNVADLNRKVNNLSGGQKKRLALAKLLIDAPEFIILDEPTNHLDLDMIEWLEKYLQQGNLTLFMVTHDRYFLENVCNNIIELDGGKLHRYKGNYSDFLEKKAIRTEVEASTLDKNKKLLSKELDWMRRQPQARGTKAKSRIDDFYELKEETSKKVDTGNVQISIKERHLGSKILELHHVCKSYGSLVILDKFEYKFRRKERVGIVGPNGVGKSTFLKMIMQEEMPDTGKITIGETIVFGYYSQAGMLMKEDKRVIDVITDIAEYIPLDKGMKLTAVALLERFLFSRSQQQVYVSQLSGGEKRRLYLLTILMSNPNFLILDEPTNDLDVLTLQVLEDFLLEFPGCLMVVTHDRFFMDKMVEHLFIFEGNGKIRDYNGVYADYRADKQEEEEEARRQRSEQDKKTSNNTSTNNTGVGLSASERKELRTLENEIGKLEKRKIEINHKFNTETLSNDDMLKLGQELNKLSDDLENKEMRWLELSEKA
jgi:ATP-binding cassette subfamily F protein uup